MCHGSRAPLLERQPGLRPIQRLDLGFLIDAEHDRAVRRIEVETDDILTFSSNSGSFETLNPFTMCGFKPASAHMRPTLDGEMPMASAISARLQWVALGGVSCTVFAITFSFVSKGNGGTLEGRVLSRFRPATPSSRYRACQRQTVGFDVRARRMISKVPCPSAVASTISARQTSLRGVLRLVIKA